ncbi:MAG: hypothetical protein IT446_01640 [Phycisphaerales bacterium]|nr:hypothetical protein [Phycisphaerales bacterium]
MSHWVRGMVVLLIMAGVCFAQNAPNPEQLKKMYDDALDQLKAAQDRKNELAAENEKLHAQLAELQKQATILSAQLESHQRDAATQASKTFFLRSYFASWQRFIDRYPDLKVRWEAFLNADVLAVPYSVPLPENPTW